MNGRLRASRLVAAAVLGFVLLNPPFLGLADGAGNVLGVPGLVAYVFGAWALLIALVLVILRR